MKKFLRDVRRAIAYNLLKNDIQTVKELADVPNGGVTVGDAIVLIFGHRS